MKLLGWKSLHRGSLRGFIDIEVEVGNGRRLQILECSVHTGPNGPWVALPGKPQLDRDGNIRRKANGKPEYVSVLRWGDAQTRDRFSSAVIKLLREHYPHALDDVAAEAAA
jgi:hypothetical protein